MLLNDGEMRDQFPECMAVYDAKTEAASSQPELADATFGLAACLEEGIIARATSDKGLVGLTISSFPERTEAEVRDAVIGELGDMFAAGAETCAVLTEAGIDGGSLLANTLAGSCRAEAAQHVFGYMTTIVGPMSDAAPEE